MGSPAGASGLVGAAVGSSLLELELELLLESSPGGLGGGCVGNGCWAAASEGVVVLGLAGLGESGGVLEGLGESGGFLGLLVSPGNGNCSAAEVGFLAAGGQGLADGSGGLPVVWFGAGQGAGVGFCVDVWARQEAERSKATWSARVMGSIAIWSLAWSPGYSSNRLTVLRGGLL